MDYKKINQLLEKYWEGESTVQEEQQLKAYFNSDQVVKEHQEYAPLFQYFKSEKEQQLRTEVLEASFQQLEKDSQKPVAKTRQLYTYFSRAAAVLLLLAASFQVYQYQSVVEQKRAVYVEIDDTEEAYLKAKEALLLVSKKLNKGKRKANNNIKKVEKVTDIIK